MKIAYIAHPVSGDVLGNIIKIIAIVRNVNLMEPEIVPFVPYLADLYALDDDTPEERERGIKNDTHILKSGLVDELRVYGDRITSGIHHEILLAQEVGMNIRIMNRNLDAEFVEKYL